MSSDKQTRTELKEKREENAAKNALKHGGGKIQRFIPEGEFIGVVDKNGVPTEGTVLFSNGDKFEGEFKNGKPHFGWWVIDDMEYKGELDENKKFTGYGLLFTHFFYYTGWFRNGLFHGLGGLVIRGGHYLGFYRDYWGYWKNGFRCGEGTLWFGVSAPAIRKVWNDEEEKTLLFSTRASSPPPSLVFPTVVEESVEDTLSIHIEEDIVPENATPKKTTLSSVLKNCCLCQ